MEISYSNLTKFHLFQCCAS